MEEDLLITEEDDELLKFDFPTEQVSIIKVVGVGGGGGNAVTHMYKEGIRDVNFALCNTDKQALFRSEVPVKVQLGKKTTEGLGAGNQPDVAKAAAEESIEDLKKMFDDETKMVFITAGMGGGTGTGAGPIVAKVAKDKGILTVGIVTIPFLFEGTPKIIQALKGVENIRKNVDALLVINNQILIDIYGDLDIIEAFKKADGTLTTAAKSIAEIITLSGVINLDFADVNTTLKNGGVAIMNSGFGEGEGRVLSAFENALNSPLLNNNDAFSAKKILFNIYFSSTKPLKMEEMNEIRNFMAKFRERNIEVIWGTAIDDDSLTENVKVTVLAAGFSLENIVPPEMFEFNNEEDLEKKEQERREEKRLIDKYYGIGTFLTIGRTAKPKPFIFTIEKIDDNETIEAVINHPAYNRSPTVMLEIAKKAEARRRDYAEMD
jgi:cell division protein FtsZ